MWTLGDDPPQKNVSHFQPFLDPVQSWGAERAAGCNDTLWLLSFLLQHALAISHQIKESLVQLHGTVR